MRAAVLLILLLIAWPHDAMASEANEQWQIPPEFLPIDLSALPPRPEGHGWRRIANFPGGTESDCVGNLRTPLCAIDTLIAGWMRRDPGLVNLAVRPHGQHETSTFADWSRYPKIQHIRVVHEGPVRCAILDRLNIDAGCARAHRMVVVQRHDCNLMLVGKPWFCYPAHPEARTVYYLNRTGGFWEIVAYYRAKY